MEPVGTEAVETLELIPARAFIYRDVYVKCACQNCKVNDIKVPIVGTPKKLSLIPGGFVSPKADSRIMTQKGELFRVLLRFGRRVLRRAAGAQQRQRKNGGENVAQ